MGEHATRVCARTQEEGPSEQSIRLRSVHLERIPPSNREEPGGGQGLGPGNSGGVVNSEFRRPATPCKAWPPPLRGRDPVNTHTLNFYLYVY